MLQEIDSDLPPLKGIIHAAGVLDDGVITQQTWERFEQVLKAKVDGGWYLHQQTRDLSLDFFVMYSSAASILGSAGQSNYATANAFLDSLAQLRHSQGLPATSINWGPWAESGMATDPLVRSQLARQGVVPLKSETGLAGLERLLANQATQGMILEIDWDRMGPSLAGTRPPLLEAVLPKSQQSDSLLLNNCVKHLWPNERLC